MAGNFKHCLTLLQENQEDVKKEAHQILLKLCNNILKHPQDLKYRKIKIDNPVVSSKLLPAAGAIECLFEAGFVENDDEFFLPLNASLTGVRDLYGLLNSSQRVTATKPASVASTSTQKPTTLVEKPLVEEKEYKRKSFIEQLIRHFHDILRYEDQALQNKVKSILPLEKLQITAMEKLRTIQREMKIKKSQDDVVIEDLLLSELLNWFKNKFFKWVNSPACKICTGDCSYDRSIVSTNPDISRIEIHKCKICGSETEFARYINPETLLYTRKGRCGEWANCFTLICRTVGFDARLVYDKTDHVWTEVWSVAHNRWIHADACENVMDRPLMYEKGWGKKLSYVIAFSRDEIQDVTWRYTRKFEEVMKHRNVCSEKSLMLLINKLNLQRQNSRGYSQARKKFVTKRYVEELAQMLNAPPGCKKPCETSENESDYGGRTSGSLAWRISRNETGDTSYTATQWNIPRDVVNFELTYSILNDTYVTKDTSNSKNLETRQKWQTGVAFVEGGIFTKKEEDWKMIYLAKSPGSIFGKITWAFVVEDNENMYINSVKLQAKTATFHGGSVKWQVEGIYSNENTKGESKVVSILESENFETKDLKGAIKINVTAVLSGGEGESAWQHAQLFRQSLDANSNDLSMVIRIDLEKKA
ncbi:hypothetical protein TSAR_007728 [Trichomalopsis sarcophagae]|uniref:Peptide-N(4)-(N-acetyl-beta-glucosaminyl)asparagine amidase n=1 Tax=Trichomalopsis sarcophagae TaxID=543379 RepID=A0A232EVK2_9HYME|nr:hypothetical protein TSAR_007728 [Trichomalopsis sarcophagae]